MGGLGTTLLERSVELEEIDRAVAGASAGEGSTLLVEGPAGIGKTALLRAAEERAGVAEIEIRTARAGELEADLPWNLVRQLFAAEITADPDERERLMDGAAGLARPALGLGGGEESGALHGLYWLTSSLAGERPLLLAVDDLQWGDASSLRFLCYLAERARDLPLLLCLGLRGEAAGRAELMALRGADGVVRLAPEPLSEAGSAELAGEILGPDVAPEFSAACTAASGGNPFLLGELLREISRERIEPKAELAAEVGAMTPATVSTAVLMRLATIGPDARLLTEALAVLGEGAVLTEPAALAGLDPERAAAAADRLVEAEILAPGPRPGFAHPLLRESIAAEIPRHRRAYLHAEAARLLDAGGADPVRVAVQLLETEPGREAWTVARLRDAAQRSLDEGSPGPAVAFLGRALAEPPPAADRVDILCRLAGAEALSGSDRASAHLAEARAEAEAPALAASIGVGLVLLELRRGRTREALDLARELIDADELTDQVMRMRLIAAVTAAASLVPDLREEAISFLAAVPPDLPADTPAGWLALCAELAAAIARRAPTAEIGALAERILADGIRPAEMTAQELLYWNATSALNATERFAAGAEAIEFAEGDAVRRGAPVGLALCACFRCGSEQRRGQNAAAVADGRKAMAAAPDDMPQLRAYAEAFLGESLVDRGEPAEALAVIGGAESDATGAATFAQLVRRVARGRAQVAAGEVEAGTAELLGVGQAMGEGDPGPAICPWRSRAAEGLALLGRAGEAQSLATEELEAAREIGSGWGRVLALQALAAADTEQAGSLLEEAIAVAEECGFALEAARATVLLGAHLRRGGERRAARDLLQRGLEQATGLGALGVAARARDELVALGLRPRRTAVGGVESLTPAERRVAELAASGMTNPQIAQSLFVSLRTVETHLTHSYRKLDISSREQLAPLLGQRGQPASA